MRLTIATLARRGRVDAARTRACRNLQPDDPAVRFHLANVQSQLGEIGAAIENYEFSIARQPKAHDALANLSAAYRRAARVSDAIAAARKAIELRHDFPEALNNLGLALCDARAIHSYRRVRSA